jgi:hypothetical protein
MPDGSFTDRRVADRSDQIPANGTLVLSTERDACGDPRRHFPMVMVMTVDITDARGNTFTLTGETGFVEH